MSTTKEFNTLQRGKKEGNKKPKDRNQCHKNALPPKAKAANKSVHRHYRLKWQPFVLSLFNSTHHRKTFTDTALIPNQRTHKKEKNKQTKQEARGKTLPSNKTKQKVAPHPTRGNSKFLPTNLSDNSEDVNRQPNSSRLALGALFRLLVRLCGFLCWHC